MKPQRLRWLPGGLLGWGLFGVALLAGSLALGWFRAGTDPAEARREVSSARRSFSLTIAERGVVQPARVVPIKSKIASNRAKIIWLAEEGTQVNKGLIVARFDPQPFIDKVTQAEQALADAQSQLLAARHARELQQEEGAGRIEAAERQLAIARIKAKDLREGSGALEALQLEHRLARAEREYAQAQQAQQDLAALAQAGHGQQREREAAARQAQTAREARALARQALQNFRTYERPRMEREATSLVEAASSQLQRVKRTAELQLQQRRAEIIKYQRRVARAQQDLKKAQVDVEHCDVYAPSAGVLLYKTLPKQGERRPIQVGDAIWFGQTFLEIPVTDDMIVNIAVREIDVAKLRTGMAASIRLDAFPEQRFPGEIEAIDSLADVDAEQQGLHRFRTRVKLKEVSPAVYVGMSATVRITYQHLENVPTLPVQALIYREGNAFVERRRNGQIETVPVEIGAVGTQWAELQAGLTPGDTVLLPTW